MNNKLILILLATVILSITMVIPSITAYNKYDFVSLYSNTNSCFGSECETIYKICNPLVVDFSIQANKLGFSFIDAKNSLKEYKLSIGEQKTISYDEVTQICEVITTEKVTYPNNSIAYIPTYSCNTNTNRKNINSIEYKPISLPYTFKASSCYYLKIQGTLPITLGKYGIDNILGLELPMPFGYVDFPEYAFWNTSYTNKKQIILGNTLSTSLYDQPYLLNGMRGWDTQALINTSKLQSTCNDFRLTNASENQVLGCELEFGCNTTNTIVWCNSQVIGNKNVNGSNYLYYNSLDATKKPYNSTWGTDYLAIFHFNDTTTLLDSSYYGNNITAYNGIIMSKGLFGNSLRYRQEGSANNYIYANPSSSLNSANTTQNLTLEAWIYINGSATYDNECVVGGGCINHIATKGDPASTTKTFDWFVINSQTGGTYQPDTKINTMIFRVCNDSWYVGVQSKTELALNTWYYVGVTFQTAPTFKNISFYVNGVTDGVFQWNNTGPPMDIQYNAFICDTSTYPLYIGSKQTLTKQAFNGSIDEFRFSRQVKPIEYFKTNYLNAIGNISMLGIEETQPDPFSNASIISPIDQFNTSSRTINISCKTINSDPNAYIVYNIKKGSASWGFVNTTNQSINYSISPDMATQQTTFLVNCVSYNTTGYSSNASATNTFGLINNMPFNTTIILPTNNSLVSGNQNTISCTLPLDVDGDSVNITYWGSKVGDPFDVLTYTTNTSFLYTGLTASNYQVKCRASDNYNLSSTFSETRYFTNIFVQNCTSGNSSMVKVLEFWPYNEATNELITTGFNFSGTFWVYNIYTGKNLNNYYAFKSNSTLSVPFCIGNSDFSTLRVDADIMYSSSGFSQRAYFLLNSSVANGTQNISLYHLLTTDSSAINFRVIDQAGLKLGGVYIYVQRKDQATNTFRLVAMGKTNSNGEDVIYLKLNDPFYRFIVIKDYQTAFIGQEGRLGKGTDPLDPIVIQINPTTDIIQSLINANNVQYSLTYSNSTRTITLIFSDITGLSKTNCLSVTKITAVGNSLINRNCLTTASGTLTYTLPQENVTYSAQYTIEGSPILYIYNIIIDLSQNISNYLGIEGLFLIILVTTFMAFLFIKVNPVLALIGEVLGIIMLQLFGFINLGFEVILALLLVSGLIIYVSSRRQE